MYTTLPFVLFNIGLSDPEVLFYAHLANYRATEDSIMASNKELLRITGWSPKKLLTTKKLLSDKGILIITRLQNEDGGNTVNSYLLCSHDHLDKLFLSQNTLQTINNGRKSQL
jgi:hypothetical protein